MLHKVFVKVPSIDLYYILKFRLQLSLYKQLTGIRKKSIFSSSTTKFVN